MSLKCAKPMTKQARAEYALVGTDRERLKSWYRKWTPYSEEQIEDLINLMEEHPEKCGKFSESVGPMEEIVTSLLLKEAAGKPNK